MMTTRILELTADEVMCLSDRVCNPDCGTDEQRVSAYPLLLKLGSAFVEVVGSGQKKEGTIPIAVTESEAWLLRSKVTSTDKLASEPLFGVKLLTKLYNVLLSYNGLDELPSTDFDGDGMTVEQRGALAKWREQSKEE
jgi:hypothetical protein